MNEKNTKSFNIMQSMVDQLNKTKFAGKDTKLMLTYIRESIHWYRYNVMLIKQVRINDKTIYEERVLYSGRSEAVIGYLQGLHDSMNL